MPPVLPLTWLFAGCNFWQCVVLSWPLSHVWLAADEDLLLLHDLPWFIFGQLPTVTTIEWFATAAIKICTQDILVF